MKWLPLTNHHGWDYLLSKFGLSFLDRCHYHVSNGSCWHSVQSGTESSHRNHVQILGTSIVGAVHDGCDWQTQRNTELSSGRTSASSLRHLGSVLNSNLVKYFKQIETTQL